MKVNISRLVREHETFNRGLLGEFPFGIGGGQIDIAGKTHQLHFLRVGYTLSTEF